VAYSKCGLTGEAIVESGTGRKWRKGFGGFGGRVAARWNLDFLWVRRETGTELKTKIGPEKSIFKVGESSSIRL
jgi:hypothetical protein